MTSSTDKEMNDLAAAVVQPKEFAPQPLWPNPNWTQEAAMIAFEVHRLREKIADNADAKAEYGPEGNRQ